MSTESPQAAAAGDQAKWQADLARQLSGVALPELQGLTGKLSGILGSPTQSGQLAPDAAIKKSAADQLTQSFGQARMGSNEAIQYGALRSGYGRLSPGATNSSVMSAATSLDRDRASAMRNLDFMSAQSSMGDYNQILQLLGQGAKTGLGLAGGFSGAAGGAIGGLSNQSQFGGALGGAAAGAGLGASVGGPYGAVIGGVVGGVGGYMGAG